MVEISMQSLKFHIVLCGEKGSLIIHDITFLVCSFVILVVCMYHT